MRFAWIRLIARNEAGMSSAWVTESKTVNAKHFLNNAEAVTFDKTDLAAKGGGGVPAKAELARPKDEKPGGGGKAGAGSNPVED